MANDLSTIASLAALLTATVTAGFGYLSTRTSKTVESGDKAADRLDRRVEELLEEYRGEIGRLRSRVEALEQGRDEDRQTIRQHEATIDTLTRQNAQQAAEIATLKRGQNGGAC